MGRYIDGKECEELAAARRAAPPFTGDQTSGNLIAISFREFDGTGQGNVRLTMEQASALRKSLSKVLDGEAAAFLVAKSPTGELIEKSE
jgi:hypothetical protein